MRRPALKLMVVLVLAVAGVGLVSDRVLASTPTVKGKGKLFQSSTTIVAASSFVNIVLEVPEKQTFVITDVIAVNVGVADNSFGLQCVLAAGGTSDLLPGVPVAAGESFSHSFGTGLECAEGDTLRMVPGDDIGATFKVVVIGYYRKGS
jgi:hypothetical protein